MSKDFTDDLRTYVEARHGFVVLELDTGPAYYAPATVLAVIRSRLVGSAEILTPLGTVSVKARPEAVAECVAEALRQRGAA